MIFIIWCGGHFCVPLTLLIIYFIFLLKTSVMSGYSQSSLLHHPVTKLKILRLFYHLMLFNLCTLDVLFTLNTHYLQNPWTCENTQTSNATFVIKLNICFKVVPMPCPNCLLLSLCIIKYRVPAVLFIKHIKTALNCLKYVHYIFLVDMLYLCYTK